MKKADIVARVAGRAGLSKSVAEAAVNAVLDAIAEGLAKEEEVRIAGFGTFATRDRRARTGRNPRTGESVSIPASKAPSFKAGKALRDVVCRGWQAKAGDRRDAGDTRQGRDGDSGTRLDVSKWPGGVAPVWTMLDPESAQALAKHRLFAWLDARVCPDHQLVVIARDDDTAFGILHSRFHQAWSLRLGTSLEDRPRYTPTTTFETFPFPDRLSPDIPADDYADDPRAVAIAEAARRLVELRNRWLNPPEWVEWVEEPVPGYPKRPVARDDAAAKELKSRTLTNLYNARPQWLDDAHAALDAAVAEAYGWDEGISENEALMKLLSINASET